MSHALDTIYARLDYAWQQFQALDRVQDAYYVRKPLHARLKRDTANGDYLVMIELTQPVPPEMGFLTGDFVNNVRASLDNLTSVLPGANITRAAFPILKQPPKKLFAQHDKLKGIDPAAVAVIESLQPYVPTRNASSVPIPIGQVLLRLDSLWNCDKHRSPTYAFPSLQSNRLQVDTSKFEVVERDFGAVAERHVMLRLRPTGRHGLNPQFESDLRAQIAIKEEPGLAGTVPVDLADIHDCVRNDVVPLFARFM